MPSSPANSKLVQTSLLSMMKPVPTTKSASMTTTATTPTRQSTSKRSAPSDQAVDEKDGIEVFESSGPSVKKQKLEDRSSGGKKMASIFSNPTSTSTSSLMNSLSSSSSTLSSALKSNLAIPIPSTTSFPSSIPPTSTSETPSDPTATPTPTIQSIKESFIHALTEEQKEYLTMEIGTMGDDWFVALRGEMCKPYFKELKKFVMAEQRKTKILPPAKDVYSWTRLCPLAGIRVVIIGQDPYHNDGQAHGLAFSVRKGVAVPPSLRNIYKEIGDEIPGFKAPKHGDLTSWAKQGVLLLNTSLTVKAHEAGSHSKKGWETFTTAVLKLIIDRLAENGAEKGTKGVVFMAWGAPAGKLVVGVNEKYHHVLKSAHPSPLAAHRGFFGNGHFVKCNEWLEKKYGVEAKVRWESVMDE